MKILFFPKMLKLVELRFSCVKCNNSPDVEPGDNHCSICNRIVK